jgi:phosphohistidine phosphatase
VKSLHLLRHAKSDWSDSTLDDHDRPLNPRGKRARRLIAAHVEGWSVDLVVCSTARRARQTAAPVVRTLGCPLELRDSLYRTDAYRLLSEVLVLPDSATSVMFVGHNPATEQLSALLTGADSRYPTAALGTIELAVDRWADVVTGAGTLRALYVARDADGD